MSFPYEVFPVQLNCPILSSITLRLVHDLIPLTENNQLNHVKIYWYATELPFLSSDPDPIDIPFLDPDNTTLSLNPHSMDTAQW